MQTVLYLYDLAVSGKACKAWFPQSTKQRCM